MSSPIHSNLIQHESIVPGADQKKVVIGPRKDCPTPEIQLIKNGDIIESIEVTCRCGETIRIECQYE